MKKFSIDIQEETTKARHEFLMAPITIRTYGGRSFAGFFIDHDVVYRRYLAARRAGEQAYGQTAAAENGYLP